MKHNWERDENGSINEWAWESGFHNGVFCVDCGKNVCVHCNPDYMELDDCTGPQKPKVITNADHIRAMSAEELAEFLCHFRSDDAAEHACSGCKAEPYCRSGHNGMIDWLQQPAKEDT